MRDLLYAPWRHNYVTGKESVHDRTGLKADGCVFCQQFAESEDGKHFILRRFSRCAIMLNRYPYNPGHVMILPFVHKPELHDLEADVRREMMEVLSLSMPVIQEAINCQGFNVGINLGLAGGGGIPSHLHIHVLPRWQGDTNFLELINNTKVISSQLEQTFADLQPGFAALVQP